MPVDERLIVCVSEWMRAYLFAGGWAAAKEAARRDHGYHQSARETQHKVSCESHTHTLTQNTLVILFILNTKHFNDLTCHIVDILHNDVVYVLYASHDLFHSALYVRSCVHAHMHARVCCSWACMLLFVILVLLSFCLTFSLCVCLCVCTGHFRVLNPEDTSSVQCTWRKRRKQQSNMSRWPFAV